MEMKIDKPIKMEMEWRHKKSNKPRSEKILEFIIKAGGISCIILILAILFFILKESAPFLISRFDFKEFFLSTKWNPASVVEIQYGILALLVGTLLVTIISMLIAVPLGLACILYFGILLTSV
jgi:phosphate transport system permease protein